MKITKINNLNTKSHTPYIEAKEPVETQGYIKPLTPQGHLVRDSFVTVPKFIVKDFQYDLKALKDGIQGNANDHQLGRMNSFGLKIGGLGIATLLAAKTKNPNTRFMEYLGFGAFLTSMSLYPRLAINAPAKMVHGFDIGQEYIDDQGRKKSVFQDPNYIPWDMYRGDIPEEDLDIIGDRLGIPRDIKNRNDLIKEQARKIAIQNNTLWMLTAGLATPIMTALICNGLERPVSSMIESIRNSSNNSKIAKLLEITKNMPTDVNNIDSNRLSKKVEKFLSKAKDKNLTQTEFDELVKIITKDLDSKFALGIKEDLSSLLRSDANGMKSFVKPQNFAEEITEVINKSLTGRNKTLMSGIFTVDSEKLNEIIKKCEKDFITEDELKNIEKELKSIFDKKIEAAQVSEAGREFLSASETKILNSITDYIGKKPANVVGENVCENIIDLAKVVGEFKENHKKLIDCKSFKVGEVPETVIAKSYGKFETALFKVLDIKPKELLQMKNSNEYAKKILDKKIEALVNGNEYEAAIEKLAKVMEEMETKLHGKNKETSYMLDLVSAIENNYNNTAKRLDKIGKFKSTIDKIVKENVKTLSNSASTKEEIVEILNGTLENDVICRGAGDRQYVKEAARGVGSSKNLVTSSIVERYQGVENLFNRIIHLLDTYKRGLPEGEYDKALMQAGREALMTGTTSDYILKLNTQGNPEFYKDMYQKVWNPEGLSESTIKALGGEDSEVASRFMKYVKRFKDVIGNNNIDFTQPQHTLDPDKLKRYTEASRTRMANFNLVSQAPTEMIKKAADSRNASKKWIRKVSIAGGATLGVTLLAQFFFGKISNPDHIQKKVKNDASK